MAGARCVTAVSLKLPSGIPAHTPRHELVTGLLTRAASGYASAAVDENRAAGGVFDTPSRRREHDGPDGD